MILIWLGFVWKKRCLLWWNGDVCGLCRYVCGVDGVVIEPRTALRWKMPPTPTMANIATTVGKLDTHLQIVHSLSNKVLNICIIFISMLPMMFDVKRVKSDELWNLKFISSSSRTDFWLSSSLGLCWNLWVFFLKCFIGYAGGTKFAECFVCKQRGHLSKNCPQNAHGIYPKVSSFFLYSWPFQKYIIIIPVESTI